MVAVIMKRKHIFILSEPTVKVSRFTKSLLTCHKVVIVPMNKIKMLMT